MAAQYTLTTTNPETGIVTARICAHNRITESGTQYMAQMLTGRLEPGTPISGITHMALGLGDGSERRKYLQLENEVRRERVKSLPTQQDTNGVTTIL